MEIFASITLGWTPILALVIDGSRVVQQVTGWTGGTGTAPATGLYVGATGFVALIADAVDVRGPQGDAGEGIAAGGTANQALTKINSTDYNTQWATIDKTFVGLGNVDNTSDANKPVSTAQQTALNLKANIASPTFTGTVGGITASMVGLGNVPNVDATNAANISSGTLPLARIVALVNANLSGSAAITYANLQQVAAFKILGNPTDTAAVPSEITYKQVAEQSFGGTVTWNGTPPSGSSSITYRWSQIGNQVTLIITAVYSVAGTTNTNVSFTLPSDCPTPVPPTGLTSASNKIYPGYGYIDANLTGMPGAGRCILGANAGNNGYEISISAASVSARYVQGTVIYYI